MSSARPLVVIYYSRARAVSQTPGSRAVLSLKRNRIEKRYY
jgi:hypothetical protein